MPARDKPDSACVALLRGINVGGANIIRMEALRKSFEAMGFTAVRTLLASGNVVFRTVEADARKLEGAIEKVLSRNHRYAAKVVVRSSAEYARMMRAMPPRWGSEKGLRYYVIFLRHAIDRPSLLRELQINEGVEELRYVPGALLWSARLDRLTASKMSKVIARPIYQDMTVRNLNTTRKIYDLMKHGGGWTAGGPTPRARLRGSSAGRHTDVDGIRGGDDAAGDDVGAEGDAARGGVEVHDGGGVP